jgi:hypothetical protein
LLTLVVVVVEGLTLVLVGLGDAAELVGAIGSSIHAALLLELTESLLDGGLEDVASWALLVAELELISLEVGQRWLMFVRIWLNLAVAAFCSLLL